MYRVVDCEKGTSSLHTTYDEAIHEASENHLPDFEIWNDRNECIAWRNPHVAHFPEPPPEAE